MRQLYTPPPPRSTRLQNLPGSLLVAVHFGDKRVEGTELQLIPDSLDELDFHLAPIEVAVEIEEMNFEQRRTVVDRRARAEAGDGRESAPVDSRHDSVNSVSKLVGRLERDIRRRHAKCAPQALTRNHLA